MRLLAIFLMTASTKHERAPTKYMRKVPNKVIKEVSLRSTKFAGPINFPLTKSGFAPRLGYKTRFTNVKRTLVCVSGWYTGYHSEECTVSPK